MGLAQLQTLPDPTPDLRVLPTPPAPTPAAPAKRTAGLNLGGLAAAKPKAAKKDDRPTIPATPELEALATNYHRDKPLFDALKGACETTRRAIVDACFPIWLQMAARQPDLGSLNLLGAKAEQGDTPKLLISVQNRYAATVEFAAGQEAVLAAIARPEDDEDATLARFTDNFEPGLVLALKFAKIPEAQRQAVIDDLLPIFEKHELLTVPEGAEADDDGEVSPAVECKQILKPKDGFHSRRHSAFTIEENLRLQAIIPATGMVKVTGLKK